MKIEIRSMEDIFKAINRAIEISKQQKETVNFNFNSVKCHVNEKTNIDLLVRDYEIAQTMSWKKIGPESIKEYPYQLELMIKKQKITNEIAANKRDIKYYQNNIKRLESELSLL